LHVGGEVGVAAEADGDDVVNCVGWGGASGDDALWVVVEYPSSGFEVAWVFEVATVFGWH
jgi:hypothetical protein